MYHWDKARPIKTVQHCNKKGKLVMECMLIMWYFITFTSSVKLHLYSRFYTLSSIKLEVEFRLAFV